LYDAETGLVRFGARDYDPSTGRWTAQDPIGVAGGLNLYEYTFGDPVNYVDPSGLISDTDMAFRSDHLSAGGGKVDVDIVWIFKTFVFDWEDPIDYALLVAGPVGKLAKWGVKAQKIGDGVADASKVANVIHKTERCEEAQRGLLDDVFACLTGGHCPDGLCFVAGTSVVTEHGPRPIEEVSEGDLVLSRSEVTGVLGYRPVVSTFVTANQTVLDLHLEDDHHNSSTLGVTPGHPFWVLDHGWVEARDLLPGHELFTSRGGWLRVSGATWRAHSATVYNLEVAEEHTYFAGDAEAWVHNSCGDGPFGGDKFRRTPNNLAEKLSMDEAKGGAGEVIMRNLKDPRFKGMEKLQHMHVHPDGTKTVIHYVRDPATGKLLDFKFN
jgi:RHS repeat-associated protein